ncbi:phosphotransferase [Nonomuraea sp. NPDC046802]|uniref:phosphotransferase n=1 Tax=Nonomuraea sp. NPDC046802 TaxID=3154919 RepID=UPI0033F77EC2
MEFLTRLPAAWEFSPDTTIIRAEQGTNNQTFLLRQGDLRFVLQVSQPLSAAQVGAVHRILRWLRQAGLPFQVPERIRKLEDTTRWLDANGGKLRSLAAAGGHG